MKIHVLPMSPITWCHVKRTLHLTSSHGDARVVKAVVVSVQTPDAKWLREGGQHLVRRQSSQSADQPDGDAFNSCHPLNLLSTLPSLALKYPGGIVLETSCGLQGLSSRNGHVRSGSCGGPHLPSPAPIFPGWICVPVGSCCWNCSSEKGLSMTQRGPGYNKRQTIERYTTRQGTERQALDRAQRAIPPPSRSNGRRWRVPETVHVQYALHRCSGRCAPPRRLWPRPGSR